MNESFDNGLLTDAAYGCVLAEAVSTGIKSDNRTGVPTVGTCYVNSQYPLWGAAVPLISSKAVNLKPLLVELEWYLKGTGDVAFLREHDVKIWEAWTRKDGTLGPVYGKQWRRWKDTRIVERYDFVKNGLDYRARGYKVEGYLGDDEDRVVLSREIDQLQRIIDKLRSDPADRRMMMSAWNVGELEDMALPPCHFLYHSWSREMGFEERLRQANAIGEAHAKYLHESRYTALLAEIARRGEATEEMLDELGIPRRALCAAMIQRSVDVFVGMPFNISGYGVLTALIAQVTNHMPMMLFHFGMDVHVYENHMDGVNEMMDRDIPEDSNPVVLLPDSWEEVDDFRWQDVRIEGYNPLPWIKVPVAV
ncbi:thymidylate synthase [Raoultella ornithinolytica]|uniref:thymidylate synthase n=1 Tax=Raoultella ornithinolytica TaxID=54291 RepID=UPI000B5AB241|nr:thymidylate synthase [Raoultella ornithinolytica]MTF12938.1 thymidylate synthase [Raoultella ornithinolytica]OWY88156.1 thymidylate synthase [Raoultella ornithinolytica]